MEHSEAMVDLELEVKDGLLAIECAYPSEKDLQELPRVWLTSNETEWDPSVLDKEDGITVTSCWDGTSEFITASRVDAQQEEEVNQFNSYII